MKKQKLMLGDNIQSLKKLPDNSIDSVVSDPPYGLSFMGKKWDYDVPSVDFWKEVYRILKPGGHILSFGGTRTYHRMVVNIEDAGFEIRDQIQWLYGSGFPKSYNIGKGIEKFNETGNASWNGTSEYNGGFGYTKIQLETGARKSAPVKYSNEKKILTNEWKGWGSALKPANEPICLARKPLSEKSIAENVLKWKTGGINVDGCRVESDDKLKEHINKYGKDSDYGIESKTSFGQIKSNVICGNNEGRFPANLILDESAAEMLDEQSGIGKSSLFPKTGKPIFNTKDGWNNNNIKDSSGGGYSDQGGASRFFYVAKVSKAERNMGLDEFEEHIINFTPGFASKDENGNIIKSDGTLMNPIKRKNTHPTVKPVNLMSYLCKLITPPNGIILDPFMGSGSTGIAALLNDFRFVGMEMDNDYFKIAEARINSYEDYKKFLKK